MINHVTEASVAPARRVVVPAAPVGVHAPVAGGLARAGLAHLDATGAQVIQVYVSNPRGWAQSPGDPRQDEAFRAGCADRDARTFVHAPLLINLGSPNPETVTRAVASLRHSLVRAAAIGAEGVVFHAGSAVGADRYDAALAQVREALLPLLDEAAAAGAPRLLVEPSAGGGRSLAATVGDLGPYLDAVDWHPWLRVCLDTCHAYAAGHDLAAPGGATATLDELVATVTAERLALVHANDSKDPLGSTRDRHANLGTGYLGRDCFAELLAHPALTGVPVLAETPSENDGQLRDVAMLRELRGHPVVDLTSDKVG